MLTRRYLLIGDVFVDTHLEIPGQHGCVVRLGGIFHAARGFCALGLDYALAYYAPSYLEEDIKFFAKDLKSTDSYCLGVVDRSPQVIIVKESQEVGDQGYENILHRQIDVKSNGNLKSVVEKYSPTDILILPGKYSLKDELSRIKDFGGSIHIDVNYDCTDILDYLECDIETIIVSTSSDIFRSGKCKNIFDVSTYFQTKNVKKFLLKENRGGACCLNVSNGKTFESCAHLCTQTPTLHSVGVGDVFNTVFISPLYDDAIDKKMQIASLCAAYYSRTMSFEQFKNNLSIVLGEAEEFLLLDGVRLPWEKRQSFPIYMAAPDFPDADTRHLDYLVHCLKYHNFVPRLPIRENGLFSNTLQKHQEIQMYNKDLVLLEECKLLIATILYNDPGTYTELGIFRQMQKPTIIYDPHRICKNMFARNTPTYLCDTLDGVINATFEILSKE